jgi:hypothetical protein
VIAKIEWHAGELFPKIGFIVTNLRWKSSNVVKFYNKRGTAEQWIKEGKYALNWTRLSCQFSVKLPRKRKSLTVQGDFDKIINTDRSELCFLGV